MCCCCCCCCCCYCYSGGFLLYAVLAAVGLLFLYLFLPETKGKRLEEIEEMFQQRCLVGCRGGAKGDFGACAHVLLRMCVCVYTCFLKYFKMERFLTFYLRPFKKSSASRSLRIQVLETSLTQLLTAERVL